jgi:hypothetical protein
MSNMRSLWRGELSLSDAFWNWAAFGGLVVNVVSSALFLLLVMSDYLILALIVGYAFSIPYNFMVSVGVWRSADRYSGDPRWAVLARIVTTVGMILLSVT